MDFGDDERPYKKRRFFVDQDETRNTDPTPNLDASSARPEEHDNGNGQKNGTRPRLHQPDQDLKASPLLSSSNTPVEHQDETLQGHTNVVRRRNPTESTPRETPQADNSGFDTELFTSIVGERLPASIVEKIRIASNNNVETAVNVYFDGSWKKTSIPGRTTQSALTSRQHIPTQTTPFRRLMVETTNDNGTTAPAKKMPPRFSTQPSSRYIGAFGVAAWATRSGTGLLKHGERVKIERTRSQPLEKRGRGGKMITNQKVDVLTRFTNQAGQEIGRLPRDTAEWVSPLIDQKICTFDGICVFVPDRLRVNDTVYLQLWCYLRKEAFMPRAFIGTTDDNRSTGVFEEKESMEEKNLRLRQVGLVRLFDEIGLYATTTNDMTKKHKKEGLLRAAEMSEQYDKVKKENKTNNSPQDEDNEEPELEEDQLDTLYKKAQTFDFNMPEAQPSSTFAMELRKYQRQALHWMLSKEKDNKSESTRKSMHPLWEEYQWPTKDADDKDLPIVEGIDYFYVNLYSGELSIEFPAQEQNCLGGILADEMGLGKTIEMLSLVNAHKYDPGDPVLKDPSMTQPDSTGVVPAPYTTLVIAPTSLLAQWESEAQKSAQSGTMNTMVYYGTEQATNLRKLCCATNAASAPHVIVTSYGVVLSEYGSHVSRSGWQTESWYGSLFTVKFHRVILDEAHVIKNRRSKTARACYDLNATHRWVLTGTPIVNRLEDLFSLVRFLKVEPWNNFSFWKTFITVPFESKDYARALNVVQTVLEPLVLRRTKTMKTPEGEPLVPLPRRTITIEEVDLSEEEREVYDFIYTRAKRTFNDNVEAGTLLKSYSTIFAQILRLRQSCCHPILTRNKAIVADEEEAATAANASNGLQDDMDLQDLIARFTTATESGEANEGQGQDPANKFTTYALKQIQNESSGECPICSEEPMIDPAVTACWHSACKQCLEDYIRHQIDKGLPPRCFSCRAPVSLTDIFEVVKHQSPNSTPAENEIYSNTPPSSSQPVPRISLRRINPLSPSAHTSAKIHSLLNHLSRVPPNTKSVVFSQFTSFLDLISPQLTKAGIQHVRLDGTMPQKARAEVLAQFNKTETYEEIDEDPTPTPFPTTHFNAPKPKPSQTSNPTVLLISLRAGGVGLNLTAANNVFMMDPWWSFAIEAQAIDRVHRMGQLRDVNVTRFVVKDSIEGRMLRVQDRKMNIAGSLGLRVGGDGDGDDKKKDRIEELRLLFE
ncbi:DEAD/DEAH box helicase [Aspergillus glaucus CBS 516.65]|uniref:DNA repair protein rad5 n=1 Tax=Aspergillus glaucus CBS 516.65 TaxID=1160497 RepID=A0A1L9VBW9_ASPGL|nr:hypothetical protein ASPGLDRAFT_177222 [Aspergillus glaucus CBS 516.65]OJJ81428.1 hypothetical protein ASPGLDRAFT_177222 [Aspergillus glaucus CBS 516.65]